MTVETLSGAQALFGLERAALLTLAAGAVPERFQGGALIEEEGRAARRLHLVTAGEVAVVRLAGHDRELVTHLGPGSLFGLAPVGGGAEPASVMATCDTETLSWEHVDDPELGRQLLTRASLLHRRDELLRLLATSDLFRGTSPQLLRWLTDSSTLVPYRRGQIVMRQGEPGDSMAVVVKGELSIEQKIDGGAVARPNVHVGGCVGEIALLEGTARGATVVAARDAELLVIQRESFAALLRDSHAFRRTISGIARERLEVAETASADVILILNETEYDTERIARLVAADLDATFGERCLVASIGSRPEARPVEGMDRVERRSWPALEAGVPLRVSERLRAEREIDLVLLVIERPLQAELAPAFLEQAHAAVYVTTNLEAPFPYRAASRKPLRYVIVGRPEGLGRTGAIRIDLGVAPSALPERLADLPRQTREAVGRLARAIRQREVGIALGGGAGWAWAHLPLLVGLREQGIPIDMVAGVSFGAVVGAAYCSRGLQGLDDLLAHKTLIALSPAVCLYTSWPIQAFVERFLWHRRFEDLPTPLSVVATDMQSGGPKTFRRGAIAPAIRASCSIPGWIGPTVLRGHRYVDGCIVDNVPVATLREEGADFVIASNVVPKPAVLPPEPHANAWQRTLSVTSPLRRWRDGVRSFYMQAHLLGERGLIADAQFAPDLSRYWSPDYSQARDIVEHAARQVEPVLADIRARYRAMGRARAPDRGDVPFVGLAPTAAAAEPESSTARRPAWARRPEIRSDGPPDFFLRNYLRATRLLSAYFRYECEGFERLRQMPTSLLVGYHGRPFAWDLALLSARMYDELGYYPRTFTAKSVKATPLYREIAESFGALYEAPDAEEIARMRAAGHHLVVTPGGMREAVRPFWIRYRVDFGNRRGYCALAHRHGLPIVPVAAVGVDDAYLGLNDGYRLSHLLLGNGMYSLWLGLGIFGFYPFALPWPVKIRQRIGEPIDLAPIRAAAASEEEFLERANRRVVDTLQGMLDDLRRGR